MTTPVGTPDTKVSGTMAPTEKVHTFSSETQGKVEVTNDADYHGIDTRAIPAGTNVVYERKVAIMNQALIDMGMGAFQWKIFAMTGFGWFVDNVRAPIPETRRAWLTLTLYSFGCRLSPSSAPPFETSSPSSASLFSPWPNTLVLLLVPVFGP